MVLVHDLIQLDSPFKAFKWRICPVILGGKCRASSVPSFSSLSRVPKFVSVRSELGCVEDIGSYSSPRLCLSRLSNFPGTNPDGLQEACEADT